MPSNLLAIIGNTFTETLRAPVYCVIIAAAILLLVFGPSLSMFTIDDDNKLLKDTGLSTLLVAGLFLAVFAATTVVTGEIDNKTVLTVVTKSVSRYTFILGKFLGIAAAVLVALYLLTITLMIVVRHGALQRASDHRDWVVIVVGSIALAATILIALAGNYFYRWRFTAAAVFIGTIVGSTALIVLALIDPYWKYNPSNNHLDANLLGPLLLVAMASMIMTAIAVAASTRLGLVMTLLISAVVFVLGISLQPWLSPVAQRTGIDAYAAKAALTIVPCFNFFLATNAVYEEAAVPWAYMGQAGLYALLYVGGVLLFTIVLFRGREIG